MLLIKLLLTVGWFYFAHWSSTPVTNMKKRKEWKIEELLKVQQNTNAWTLIFFALLQSTISLFFLHLNSMTLCGVLLYCGMLHLVVLRLGILTSKWHCKNRQGNKIAQLDWEAKLARFNGLYISPTTSLHNRLNPKVSLRRPERARCRCRYDAFQNHCHPL